VQTRDALAEGPGLTDVLAGDARWEQVVRRAVNAPSLSWVEAGKSDVPLADLLAGPEWNWVCSQARLCFDFILVDGVALGEDAAAPTLVHATDAVVLVARPGWTTHPALASAQALIPSEKLAGIVLNG
jgi:Mrp family chromosome partitioning ATPase